MKTPIEQLIEDLIKHDLIKADGFTTTLMLKAKQIEREHIIEAHGNKLKQSRGTTNFEYWYTGEDYYNDNFKNTNS
jgi:hypothetical protein